MKTKRFLRANGEIIAGIFLILIAIAGGLVIYNYLTSRSDSVFSKAEVIVQARQVYYDSVAGAYVANITLYNPGPSDVNVIEISVDGMTTAPTYNPDPSPAAPVTIAVGGTQTFMISGLDAGKTLNIEFTFSDGSVLQVPVRTG